jgi:hypothetical protein
MPTRGVGYAHRNQPKMATFCPWCGGGKLERDLFRRDNGIQEHHVEYICLVCGVGFNLAMSARSIYAVRLIREHSKLRNGCLDTEDGNQVPNPVSAQGTVATVPPQAEK